MGLSASRSYSVHCPAMAACVCSYLLHEEASMMIAEHSFHCYLPLAEEQNLFSPRSLACVLSGLVHLSSVRVGFHLVGWVFRQIRCLEVNPTSCTTIAAGSLAGQVPILETRVCSWVALYLSPFIACRKIGAGEGSRQTPVRHLHVQ